MSKEYNSYYYYFTLMKEAIMKDNPDMIVLPQVYVERLVRITQEAALVAFEHMPEAMKRLRTELALMAECELPIMEEYMKTNEHTALSVRKRGH
jgi:hypothetical protein